MLKKYKIIVNFGFLINLVLSEVTPVGQFCGHQSRADGLRWESNHVFVSPVWSHVPTVRPDSTQLDSTSWVESGRAVGTLLRRDSTQLNSTGTGVLNIFAAWPVELSRVVSVPTCPTRLNSTESRNLQSWPRTLSPTYTRTRLIHTIAITSYKVSRMHIANFFFENFQHFLVTKVKIWECYRRE